MGVHQFLGEGGRGVTKKQYIYGKFPKKGDLDRGFGAWQKIGRRVFFEGGGYLDAHYDLILVHGGT